MNITVELLKSITPEKMVELEFWKLSEIEFRKLNTALEEKTEKNTRKKQKNMWIPVGSLGEEVGISKDVPSQKVYHISRDTYSEALYYLATDTCDALFVRNFGNERHIEIKMGYWAPDYMSIANGHFLTMQQTIIDIERATKYHVSTLTAIIFGDTIQEFISEMSSVSQKRTDSFVEIVQARQITNPLIFFSYPSEKLKIHAKNAGFFAVAYVVLNFNHRGQRK